jgi:hypothetical protein
LLQRRYSAKWKLIVVGILAINLLALTTAYHGATYAGDLTWGIEENNQYSYSVVVLSGYYDIPALLELNNSVIIYTIENLPEIPQYCDKSLFCESIVNYNKASVVFENGSSINPDIESTVISLFSNAVLPIGNWFYIDRLFFDQPRGGLGADVQDPWFARSQYRSFLFGSITITCTGTPGWDADISYGDGIPITIHNYAHDWSGSTTTLTLIS